MSRDLDSIIDEALSVKEKKTNITYKSLMEMIKEEALKEQDPKILKIRNRGDVAEGLLAAAISARFRKSDASVDKSDVERELLNLDSDGKDIINTNKKRGKELVYKIDRDDGTRDIIRLAVLLARVNFDDLMDLAKRDQVDDLLDSVVAYANSANLISKSLEFALDGESTKIDILADGVSDQKGTKVDVRIFNNGKEIELGKISLKAGGTKQLGQVGKGWARRSAKSSRGIKDLFLGLFGVDIGDDLKEEYEQSLLSLDRFKIGDAIAKVYDTAFEKIKQIYAADDDAEFINFMKRLARGIRYEAVLEEEGVTLINLKGRDFEQLNFSDIEEKFSNLAVDIEVHYDDPGGDYEKVPYLRVYDRKSGRNLISVRTKLRLDPGKKIKEFRHYVQKEKGLVDLLKVAKQ